MVKAKFDGTKPHCNIDIIGHVDHGETALIVVIMKVLVTRLSPDMNKIVGFENIDKAPEERERGITINTAHTEYEIKARHYTRIDCPGYADHVKSVIAGAAQMGDVILVVAATDGVMAQTRGYILLARQVNVSYIVVFASKCDMIGDGELPDLVEMETKELLDDYDFPGDDVLIIRGSVLRALEDSNGLWGDKTMDLMNTIDEATPEPEYESDKPFLTPVEDVFMIIGHGTVATGHVERGTLKFDGEIELIGIKGEGRKTVVTGIEIFRKPLDYAGADDNVGLLPRGVNRENILRGQVPAKPGTVTCHIKFTAQIHVPTKDEDGRHMLFLNSYRPQFYFRTTDVTGVCVFPKGTEIYMPGDSVEMTIEPIHPVTMKQGLRPATRKGGRAVGSGGIVKIIE